MPSKGDQVNAVEDIGGVVFAAVPQGTEVVVVEVGALLGGLTVDFEDGRTEKVSASQVAKLNRRSNWW